MHRKKSNRRGKRRLFASKLASKLACWLYLDLESSLLSESSELLLLDLLLEISELLDTSFDLETSFDSKVFSAVLEISFDSKAFSV
ncbi:MAG: hypothetical protein ACP5H3_03010, partial [Candidatus Aenigmatarchaeota archaeon]